MMNKGAYKTFSVMEFVVLVNEIASEYFDDNGKYQPHIGTLNEMLMFYNNCVADEDDEVISDITGLDEILKDKDFVSDYEACTFGYAEYMSHSMGLCFQRAHDLAMDIVEERKQAFTRMTDAIVAVIKKVYDLIEPFASEDGINSFKEISKYISNGELDVEAIVNKYAQTKRFKEVTEGQVE